MTITLINRTKKLQLRRPERLAAILAATAESLGIDASGGTMGGEVDIVFVGKRRIRRLNHAFLGRDSATDVIAFNLDTAGGAVPADEDTPRVIGEIYVCPAVACDAARRYSTGGEYELALYCAHGLLHLAGLDDDTPEARRIMRERERKILCLWQDREALETLIRMHCSGADDGAAGAPSQSATTKGLR